MDAKEATPMLYRQGDVLFRRIEALPHKGDNHATGNRDATVVLDFSGGLFLHVGTNGVAIEHPEHARIVLPSGEYQVTIHQQYAPEEIGSTID